MIISLLLTSVLAGACPAAFAQSSDFGTNTVVVKDFDWQVSRTEHFDVYYYAGSAGWVQKAGDVLEKAYRAARTRAGHAPGGRRSFFLYANVDDMEQSNIVDVGDGTGGVTEPYKERFLVYNDGTQRWLDDVATHEYGHIVEYAILTDGFWRSARILKTAFYPLWLMEGFSEWLTGDVDDTIEETYIRDAATSDGLLPLTQIEGFAALKPHQVTLAYKEGAAAVRFMNDQFGADKVKDVFEIFKNRFDVNAVLGELIGLDESTFDKKFREYMRDKYAHQVIRERLEEPTRFGTRRTDQRGNIPEFNTSPVVAPDGRTMAYLSTEDGFPPRVAVRDLVTGRQRNEVDYPSWTYENIPTGNFTEISRTLALSKDGRTLAFGFEKNHRDSLMLADLRTGLKSVLRFGGLMTIQEPAFSPDGRKIAFSGMKDGFTDIYLYDLDSGKLENLTRDSRDDQSPCFSPDGRFLVYSSEVVDPGWRRPYQRDLFRMNLADRSVTRLTSMEGAERDPTFSPDGSKLLFTADPDLIDDLYELDLANGRIVRLTRSVGGSFTPIYGPDGKQVFFSSFRNGSIHVFSGPRSGFLDEEVRPPDRAPAPAVAGSEGLPPVTALSEPQPYEGSFSTDLFLPAFFFSSEGGLFWTSYWQGSDYLGNHQSSMFLDYNSGFGILNYQLSYAYTRFRPQWIVALDGVRLPGSLDTFGNVFTREFHEQLLGVAYPFDRFHRIELFGGVQTERDSYTDFTQHLDSDGRLLRAAFVRDTVTGRYLVETGGSRLRLQVTRFYPVLGGNVDYVTRHAEAQKFFPLGSLTTFALRGFYDESLGPQFETFSIGGVGWVEGFQRSDIDNVGSRVAVANAELRFPLVPDLNYSMWYFSPGFFFKALMGKVFMDTGYFWNNQQEWNALTPARLKTSVGVGIQLHTFVLYRYEFVAAFDIAKQLNTSNRVAYIYFGPVF